MAAISRAHVSTRQVHQGEPWRKAAKRKTWYGWDMLGCEDMLPSLSMVQLRPLSSNRILQGEALENKQPRGQ